MQKEIVIASKNPAKCARTRRLLSHIKDLRIYTLADFPGVVTPDEPYLTPEKNAVHKAKEYYKQLQKPVMASDEALYVDFLPEEEQPGVFPRRIIDRKTEETDEQILEYWVEKLKTAPKPARGAWTFAYAFVSTGKVMQKTVKRPFTFAEVPQLPYVKGYPMSSLCVDGDTGIVYSKMTEEQKQQSADKRFQIIKEAVSDFIVQTCDKCV